MDKQIKAGQMVFEIPALDAEQPDAAEHVQKEVSVKTSTDSKTAKN